MYDQIVPWIRASFQLDDSRLVDGFSEMVWGAMHAHRISFADIGRNMAGSAKPASNITRVYNWCRNPRVDPIRLQESLARHVFATIEGTLAGQRIIPLAMDWHSYNNGTESSLRISLMTGSRAIPLLWHEVATSDLSGKQTAIEVGLVQRLLKLRPPDAKFMVVLDAGFRDHRLFELLAAEDYFIVRCPASACLHTPECCWGKAGELPVKVNQVVEFGWMHWNAEHPSKTRVVGSRITDKRSERHGRRHQPAAHDKRTKPGLCVISTNLPTELADAVKAIRIYSRRFEIEHSFRDSKNATLGLDMDHTDLSDSTRYSRLMCIVAVAMLMSWLIGAEAEAKGLHLDLSPSRPRDAHRVLSLVRVGRWCIQSVEVPIERLMARHLPRAAKAALKVIGLTWRDPKKRLRATNRARSEREVRPIPEGCRKRSKGKWHPCTRRIHWRLEDALLERAA
jgi:hypothetical protein